MRQRENIFQFSRSERHIVDVFTRNSRKKAYHTMRVTNVLETTHDSYSLLATHDSRFTTAIPVPSFSLPTPSPRAVVRLPADAVNMTHRQHRYTVIPMHRRSVAVGCRLVSARWSSFHACATARSLADHRRINMFMFMFILLHTSHACSHNVCDAKVENNCYRKTIYGKNVAIFESKVKARIKLDT